MRKNLPLATIRMLLIDLTAAIALISEGAIVPTQAGDDPGDLINYSFTLWIGSGIYKVKSADKRCAVLRASFAYTLRPAQYDKAAFHDKLELRLLLPALVFVEDETDLDSTFKIGRSMPVFSSWQAASSTGWTFLKMVARRI